MKIDEIHKQFTDELNILILKLYISISSSQVIENPKILLHRSKTIFSIGCFVLATFYGITQVVRYIENKDSSIISQQIFNDKLENTYPTFTICLKGKEIYWKNEQDLIEKTGMTSSQYVDLLKGEKGYGYKYNETTHLYRKESVNENKILQIYDSSFYLNPSEIIVGTQFIAQNKIQNTHYGYGEEAVNLPGIPFHVGHQASDEICFTRDSTYESGLFRAYDEVLLNRSLLDAGNHRHLEAKIIVHNPGQLMEHIKTPSHQFILEDMKDKNRFWEGKVSQVSVLRNRPDSSPPCYDGPLTDDTRFRQEAIKRKGCIPIYWKNLKVNTTGKNFCTTREEYQDMQAMISSYFKTLPSEGRSCTSMDTLVLQEKTIRRNANHITIKVSYMGNTYQKTENIQDFSFESFFSSLGGFIGIFLGYSMLQIPELLGNIPFSAIKLRSSALIGNFFDNKKNLEIINCVYF